MKRFFPLFAASLFLLGPSIVSARGPGAAAPNLPDTKPTDKTAEKPITSDEATKWAAAMQHAVRAQDVDTFNRLVDWDAFIATATALPGKSASDTDFRANFASGLKTATVAPRSGFGRSVMAATELSGDYKALRIHNEGKQTRVLFRLVSSNGALNYHDWVLGRSADGKVAAVDCYVFLIGEMYTQNLRRSFLPLAHRSGATETLTGPEKDFVAHFGQFAQMGQFVRDRNWRQALNTYKALPPSVQESKPAMTLRLLATQAVSDADYLATIDDFRKHYPNDPMIDLISVDGYILRKSYDKAINAINRVDKAIGGDPYLKVLRANVLLQEKKFDTARDMVKEAVAQDPNLLRGYYALIEISLTRQDYAETVKWLQKAESLGVVFGDLTANATFNEFVKSPEYKAWVKTHDKQTTESKTQHKK